MNDKINTNSIGEKLGPKWSFFGVGFLGLYQIFSVFWFFGGILILREYLILGIIVIFIYITIPIIQSRIIWTSTRNLSINWLKLLIKIYVIFSLLFSYITPPLIIFMFFYFSFTSALEPLFLLNDNKRIEVDKTILENEFGINISNKDNILVSTYYKYPILDYEFESNLFIRLNENKYSDNSTSNKVNFQYGKPNLRKIDNIKGIDCKKFKIEEFCNYDKEKKEIFFDKKILRNDNEIFIMISEDRKILWFQNQQW